MSTADLPDEAPSGVLLRTTSGSAYNVEGAKVRRVTKSGKPGLFSLVALSTMRLRYTDGERLFTSSMVVEREAL